jgi:hypothetical protein
MTTSIGKTIVFLATVALAACRSPAPVIVADNRQAIAAELIALEDGWCAAVMRGDVASVDSILAPDFMGTTSRGRRTSKEDELAAVKDTAGRTSHCVHRDQEVRVYDNAALVTGTSIYSGVYEGVPFKDRTTYTTDVYIRRDGKWRCVSSHVTLVAEQQAKHAIGNVVAIPGASR